MKNDLCQLQILDWKNPENPPAIAPLLPDGDFRKILLKPNWVLHASHPEFPIEALVTSSALIEAVIQACFSKYHKLESLIVGDVPLQSCDFEKMCRQSGIYAVQERCAGRFGPRVRFLDLRRERYRQVNGFLELESEIHGDPSGYAEVVLDERSQLEEISHRADSFRVSDYDPEETRSVHHKGFHRYLVARSVLDADLVINLPKMKTHQKSGVTGALKNLVGINGSKAYLVHHHLGKPSQGGDEFPETASALFIWQVRLREILQKKSRWMFRAAKGVWEIVKKLRGIQTVATRESLGSGNVYVGAGSWHGNDSIWRMVYDLNLILVFGKAEGGALADTPQRRVVSIMDGFVAGEGNGPLQPIPVKTGVLLASENPFLLDFAMAKLMGFDWRKIRLLSNHRKFAWAGYANFDPHGFEVILDGHASRTGVDAIPVLKNFLPPPGWLDHIELEAC
jgi:uncharacterized protein (DUF362 family)